MLRLLILSLCVLASGCSIFDERLVVHTQHSFSKIECGYAQPPAGIVPLPIKPQALLDEHGVPWIALTPRDYEHLAINTQESIRYIKDQKGVIHFYEKCIETFNTEVERLNSEQKSKAEELEEE